MLCQEQNTWAAVQTIAAIITALGVLFLLWQVYDQRKWNKMHMAFQILPSSHDLNELEIQLNDSFVKLIDRQTPLTPEEATQLFTDENKKLRILLKNYLNMIEAYCAAINYGIVDEDVAKAIYEFKFRRHFLEMKSYILETRARLNADNYMCELEKVVARWSKHDNSTKRY